LFGDAKKPSAFSEGAYSEPATQATYDEMRRRAGRLLRDDGGVVLDATFRQPEHRAMFRSMAIEESAAWKLIECRLPSHLIKQRLEQRAVRKDGVSDANFAIYEQQLRLGWPQGGKQHEAFLPLETTASLVDLSRRASAWLHIESR
jgi:predicted kinase